MCIRDSSLSASDPGRIVEGRPGDVQLHHNQLITIAFLPQGSDIPRPPSKSQIDQLVDVATTLAPGPPTTAFSAGTTVGSSCVAVSEALPPGAPAVPVEIGRPPGQLVKRELRVGTGAQASANATVTVNYIGVACSTGKIFDSSYSRNQPVTLSLSNVIRGWQDGIPGMRVGGQRLLGIPPHQAYGETASPPNIGPNETLWFVVDLLSTRAG